MKNLNLIKLDNKLLFIYKELVTDIGLANEENFLKIDELLLG